MRIFYKAKSSFSLQFIYDGAIGRHFSLLQKGHLGERFEVRDKSKEAQVGTPKSNWREQRKYWRWWGISLALLTHQECICRYDDIWTWWAPKNAPGCISQKAGLCWKKWGTQSIQMHYYSLKRWVYSLKKKFSFIAKFRWTGAEGYFMKFFIGWRRPAGWALWLLQPLVLRDASLSPHVCSRALCGVSRLLHSTTHCPWETISAASTIGEKNSFKPFASSYFNIRCMFSFGSCSSKSPQRHSFHTLPID